MSANRKHNDPAWQSASPSSQPHSEVLYGPLTPHTVGPTHSNTTPSPHPLHPLLDGRKPIYILSLVFFVLGSLAVSMARSARTILIARAVQGFGMSSGNALGLAVIGDIYKLEERGMATGVFNAVRVFPFLLGSFWFSPSHAHTTPLENNTISASF